jgi:hypothetical protein
VRKICKFAHFPRQVRRRHHETHFVGVRGKTLVPDCGLPTARLKKEREMGGKSHSARAMLKLFAAPQHTSLRRMSSRRNRCPKCRSNSELNLSS